jgi:tyrosyl-tRNA synthetase
MIDRKTKLKLIEEVGEEIVTREEIEHLLTTKRSFIAYDGFEPSGQIHLPQGILRAINVNKMILTGAKFKMLVADWHAWANHKMDGDLEKIKLVGKYFIEVWHASGMNLKNVEFVWASDLVRQPGYWETLMKIAIQNNLPRVIRTVQIMGREETENLSASQILYPLMQATDIFLLGAEVTQLGMDQRKVNMLAREVAEDLGYKKPIVVSHHMLLGLLPPKEVTQNESTVDRAIRMKMSKSKPDSAIFMTDTREDIERKLSKAWCPEGEISENPVLEYCKYIVFEKSEKMEIKRPGKYGGDIEFKSYAQLEQAYQHKELFPLDLKNALAEYLNEYLEPVRKHFEKDRGAKKLKEQVESYAVTR